MDENRGEDQMKKIIDLTHNIEEGMLTFNAYWHTQVSITQMGKIDSEGRETRKLVLGTHTGTHMDAPLHFIRGGGTVDNIQLDKLVGEVTIVDFSALANSGSDASVTKEMLEKIQISNRMLFKFGWGKHWNTDRFYKGYPHFTKEAAEYLVSKDVQLIGMDTASPDDGRIKIKEVLGTEQDSPVHKIFLKNNTVIVEYLNLEEVTEYEGWNIAALPLKIKGADGSSSRVILFK
ncbi:TPA: cyclase family protein [Candidatus Micrarchaeota archaeon]|nr:cyclase family protein [Candidatus Micrarchaeota archaeon]